MIVKLIAPLAFLLSGAANAQVFDPEFATGRDEYMAACAACHGENADGNGPIATMFQGKVPDLTQIAARNDGLFPTLKIFQIIDGRTGVRGHGNPMPVFGKRYAVDLKAERGTYGAEPLVRARVLELVFYLESIQQ